MDKNERNLLRDEEKGKEKETSGERVKKSQGSPSERGRRKCTSIHDPWGSDSDTREEQQQHERVSMTDH